MKTTITMVLLLACAHLPARADEPCQSILTGEQIKALNYANDYGSSYEILTYEFRGRIKAVVLVGEKTHQKSFGMSVGSSLYQAFDRTAFSFRRKMDLDDKLLGHLAAPILTAVFKLHVYFHPKERAELEDTIPHIDAYFRNSKAVVNVDPALKPFTDQTSLVNNVSYEVHDDQVLRLARMDIHKFLAEVQADPAGVRTINLERGFQPNWRDRMRSKMFSINAAAITVLIGSMYALPGTIHVPLIIGGTLVFGWQAAGVISHGDNASPGYRYVFPFIYVGDKRRNESAVPNILNMVAPEEVNNAVVIVEQRRLADLRDRLIQLGFTSVDAKPGNERWMHGN